MIEDGVPVGSTVDMLTGTSVASDVGSKNEATDGAPVGGKAVGTITTGNDGSELSTLDGASLGSTVGKLPIGVKDGASLGSALGGLEEFHDGTPVA